MDMDEPGGTGLPPTAPPTGLDWRHLASFASANDLSAVTRLLAAGIEVDPEEGAGVTALHWACFHGNQQMATQLLEAGAKVNAALQSGRTPLHLAVLGQHSSIVDVLVERGATISLSSSSDGTPLELAVSSGQSDLVSRLLTAGANPSGTSSRTTTTSLLLTAMSLGHMHIAEQLLQAGAVASGCNSEGCAALHLAATCGDTRLFELLVAGGADINARDYDGLTPLHVALKKGHSQAATHLIGLGADCTLSDDYDGKVALHLAAGSGSTHLVAVLLAAGADPHEMALHDTPLHLAAAAGHAAVVQQLLDEPGMDPDVARPGSQYTALHAAAKAGQAAVVQQLIAAGASIDLIASRTALSPLGVAVVELDLSTVRVLVAAGANPNQHMRSTPLLHMAVSHGAPDELIRQLVQTGGANINATTDDGDTALHVAVRERQYAAVQLLLRLGADISIASDRIGTALHLAAEEGVLLAVQQMAAAGANLDAFSSSEHFTTLCTPLYLAVVQGNSEMVSLLLEAGANASQGTSEGHTPLHAAVQHGHEELAAQLLAAGADVNAVSDDFGTALAVALGRGEEAMVALLLAAGADPTLDSREVEAPLMAAVQDSRMELVRSFLAAPAIQAAKALAPAALPGLTQPSPAAGGASSSTSAAAAAVPTASTAAAAAVPTASTADVAAAAGEARASVHMDATSAGTGPLAITRAEGCRPNQLDEVCAIATRTTARDTPNSIRERMGPALAAAVAAKDMSMVGLLVKAGACPNNLDDLMHLALSESDTALVAQLLEAGASSNTLHGALGAPLHLAVSQSDAALVAQLLEGGADANLVSSKHGTPLGMAVAAQDSELVRLLLRAGARPNQHCTAHNTPLNMAAGLQEVAIAQQLLDSGANTNGLVRNGLAPLYTAIVCGNKQMVELLLARGAAMNISSSKQYGTPIQAAVYVALQPGASKEATEVVQALLAAGADPNATHHGSTTGFSLLHAAVAGRSVQLVQLLVSAGAALEASSNDGKPLHVAVAGNAEAVVRVLLEAGAGLNLYTLARHGAGYIPVSLLQQALDKRYHGVAEALLAAGADPNASHSSKCGTLLHTAVGNSDMAAAKLLLAAAANPNTICKRDGSTPLLVAVRKNCADMAEVLVAAGAQPNVVCSLSGCTPLQAAVLRQQVGLALKLLAAGADTSLGCVSGAGTLLQHAIGQGHELVEALLAAGVQPDATDGSHLWRPLQLAVHKQCCQEAASLLARGADASVVDCKSGDTLLHLAVRAGSSQLVGLLVASSADVNASNSAGELPLLMEAQRMSQCNWGIIQRLLQHPHMDRNVKDASGYTALHYAIRSSSSSSNTGVRLLLSRGADPSVRDGKGRAPLHLAAICGDVGVVEALVEAAADVSATAGSMGWTPLLLAAAAAHQDVVTCLLAGGAAANVSAALTDGTTALHMACSKPGTEQMVADLLSAGADPAAANSSGNTPLHLAAAAGEGDTIRRLLAAGAPALFCNNNRELPLHLAVVGNHAEVAVQLTAAAAAKWDPCWMGAATDDGCTPTHLAAVKDSSILSDLLRCNALPVDKVDGAGQTALHKAAAGGHTSNLRLLAQHGARLSAADLAGATPLHLAAAGGFMDAISCLASLGADRDAADKVGATPLHRLPLTSDPQLAGLLATPGNINRVVDGTTLLHTAAAGGSEEWVAAVLAVGAAAGTLDSQGKCALVTAVRKGSSAKVQLLLLRHMLWQHKLQGSEGASLPAAMITAVQVALADEANDLRKSMMALVMDVLGEDAASTLWQQLLEQHRASLPPQQGTPQPPQQQQQQQQGQEREGQLQQLKDGVQIALVQGFLEACADLAQQQANTTQPLDQAVGSFDRATPLDSNLLGGRQQAVGGSAGAAATSTEAVAQHRFVTLEHITTAAGAGKLQEVKQLLQQLPAAAHAAALGAAAHAASGAGHHLLCVQMLQQLAALSKQEASKVVQQLGLKTEGDGKQPAKVLGPHSLALCGVLLAGWQAVRRQQQQELVDSVVTAAVAWKEVQQRMVGSAAGRKRFCPSTRGHLAT